MVLTTQNIWSNGRKFTIHTNTDASNGRKMLANLKSTDWNKEGFKEIENGYQYKSVRYINGSKFDCLTIVTLKRGWAKC